MATNSQYQLEGTVKFGTSAGALSSLGDDVFACTFKRTYDAIERPGTFGSSRKTTAPGTYSDELTVSFASAGEYSGSTLAALINNAALAATPSTTLYFEFIQSQSSVGAANPRITGSVAVLEAQFGGEIGSLRRVDITFPVNTSTIATV